MEDWEAVVRASSALPGVEVGTSYGKPALKFRGATLASATAPDRDSFVLRVPVDDKDILIDTDPDTFWETDHYRGWPAILVRYNTAAHARIELLLARGWWDRATKAERRRFGERP